MKPDLCPHMAEFFKDWEKKPLSASCWECLPTTDPKEAYDRGRTHRRYSSDYHREATSVSPYIN